MPKPLNANWNLAQILYIQGLPYAAIAKEISVTEAALRQRAHRYSWRALKTAALAAVSQSVTGGDGKTLAQRSKAVMSSLAEEMEESVNTLREMAIEPNLDHLDQRADVSSKLAGTSSKVFGWDDHPASGSMFFDLDSIDAEIVESRQLADTKAAKT